MLILNIRVLFILTVHFRFRLPPPYNLKKKKTLPCGSKRLKKKPNIRTIFNPNDNFMTNASMRFTCNIHHCNSTGRNFFLKNKIGMSATWNDAWNQFKYFSRLSTLVSGLGNYREMIRNGWMTWNSSQLRNISHQILKFSSTS